MKWFIILISPFSLFSQRIDPDHQLLWEVKGTKGTSYLFGTLHSNDKRLFNFSDSTYHAMNSVNRIALEADVFSTFPFTDTRRGEVIMEFDNAGEPYTASLYPTATVYGDEDGMPQFMDAYFQQFAYNTGLEFSALETVQSQLSTFNELPLPDLSQLKLESLLTTKDDMIQRYLKGDIYALDELLKVSLSVYPDLYKELIVERNIAMSATLDSLMKIDRVFCAIGAGHLAGPSGMINLLRSKGYKVRKVWASYSELPTQMEQKIKAQNKFHYVNDTLHFEANFPGKPEIAEGFADNLLKLIYRDMGQGNTYEIEVFPRSYDIGLMDLAQRFIASPTESPAHEAELENGGEAIEGIADTYPEGFAWTRIIMSEDLFFVIKTYGGNKYMHSPRPFRFFDGIKLN